MYEISLLTWRWSICDFLCIAKCAMVCGNRPDKPDKRSDVDRMMHVWVYDDGLRVRGAHVSVNMYALCSVSVCNWLGHLTWLLEQNTKA